MGRNGYEQLPSTNVKSEPEPRTPEPSNNFLVDGFAFGLNVTTSVLIVFINKIAMDPNRGYGFVFATTLCALHFFASGGAIWATEALGLSEKARLGFKESLGYSLIAGTSIASLNLSLLLNSVGFYQVAKLLIIPFVCCVEAIWMKKHFTRPVILSIATVVLGVGIVTVSDVSINGLGLVIAAVSVVTSGLQQILCGKMQRDYKLTSNQLLSNTAPLQGLLLLLIGPCIDKLVTKQWIVDYIVTVPAATILAGSCAIAVLVNISQFMCLGRFSAVTFQVLGHLKTITVLLVGWLYFKDVMTERKAAGILLAVAGMVAYGYFISQKPAAPTPTIVSLDKSLDRLEAGANKIGQAK